MRFFIRVLFLALTLWTPPSGALELSPSQNLMTENAQSVSAWEIRGFMGIRNTKKAWSANFIWSQNGPNTYLIRFFGPMGGGSIVIQRQGGITTFNDGRQHAQAREARQLLKHQTGVDLPVHSLYYWIRALPAPGSYRKVTYDQTQLLSTLKQSGYTIAYTNYQRVQNTILPTKMTLQGKQVLVKMIIKSWHIP